MYIHAQYTIIRQTDAQAVPWVPVLEIAKLFPKELLQRQARESADYPFYPYSSPPPKAGLCHFRVIPDFPGRLPALLLKKSP
jgi:hypothetical protein